MRRASVATLCALGLLVPGRVQAFEPLALQIPCAATAENSVGTERPCITCHDNADGGGGCATPPCLNPFGTAFNLNGQRWNEDLAGLDTDGDLYSNGEELGDPDGTWRPGDPVPLTCDCATRPGFVAFTPGDVDDDSDNFCCIGQDMNGNGNCLDAGEDVRTDFDCDDDNALANSGRTELCQVPEDNDCDGLVTIDDPDCLSVVDRDGDGFCPMGRDLNRDGNCIGANEDTDDSDCNDDAASVFPGAVENCRDTFDNDCDDLVDALDLDDCRRDIDADGDRYCPLGFDQDLNGTCLGAGEELLGHDCNDSDSDPLASSINSGATEICGDGADNDCDGLTDGFDPECELFFDADGDTFCPNGRDADGDSNCTTPEELAEPGDCDDSDPTRNPGATENCLDAIDDDCDGIPGDVNVDPLADADCVGYLDGDDDGFCFIGADQDDDGRCVSAGEQQGGSDCDDTVAAINPDAPEVCNDQTDNDCDGSQDAADSQCIRFRDVDGDAFCLEGQDLNADRDCDDPGELGLVREVELEGLGLRTTDTMPTVYPGAPENCLDGIDNDLDGDIDEAAACIRTVDLDGDGFCPVGVDDDGDGRCDGEADVTAGHDCDDRDPALFPDAPMINSGAQEQCFSERDFDCDGDTGPRTYSWEGGITPPRDEDCFFLLDRDGDGFCGQGIDDNGDGDCIDEGEQRLGEDCDDTDRNIGPRAAEVCDDEVDNDCDDLIDVFDPQCECPSDDACDDGDPCTIDRCGRMNRGCEHEPNPGCGDAGPPGADMGVTAPTPGGCSVSAGAQGAGLAWLLVFGAVIVTVRRRRRGSPRRA